MQCGIQNPKIQCYCDLNVFYRINIQLHYINMNFEFLVLFDFYHQLQKHRKPSLQAYEKIIKNQET